MIRLLKRLLLFCAGIVLGYVALCLLVAGPMMSLQEMAWFSGDCERLFGLNFTIQGVVISFCAALCFGRAFVPLKTVSAPNGTTGSGLELATRGGGPVLPVCALLFLFAAFLCFMEAREVAEYRERTHSTASQLSAKQIERERTEELTARTIGVLWSIVGGILLGAPLFLKRRIWQLGWRINAGGVWIVLGSLVLTGIALFVWFASRYILHHDWKFYTHVALLGVLAATIGTVFGGIKAVAGRTSSNQPWHVGANYPSPVQKVLVFGYKDGPTDGVLQCADGHVYRFDLLAWEPQTQDVRVFALFPMAPTAWKQLTALCGGHGFPWPEQLRHSIDDILRQAGPVEWVVATEDLQGEILRVNAVRPEELIQIRDWSGFLGLTQELHDVRHDLMADRKGSDDTRIRQ